MENITDEFEKLKESFRKNSAMDASDLSKTMVVPRVEDIIEERPLEAAADVETLLAAFDAPPTLNKGMETGEEAPKMSRSNAHKKEKSTKGPKKKKKYKLNWKRLLVLLIAIFAAGCIAVGTYVAITVSKAPKINPDNIYELLSENSIIYDVNGEVLDNIYSGDSLRTNLEYNEIPKQLIDSFVSIEDKTFWNHHGFNIVRIFGAIWQKVSGQSDRIGGTSTITQQLARNLFLSEIKSQRSMGRKIIEAYYTIQLEQNLSKEQIIEAYLNTIYLGYNCNGVAAASEAYFDKSVDELSLIECAQLASLPQSPNNYAPLKRMETDKIEDFDSLDVLSKDEEYTIIYNNTAENRIKLVLRFMHDQGKIDDATYEAALADSIRNYLKPGTSAINNVTSSYFVDYVTDEVLEDLIAAGYDEETASNLLYNGGLRINSTMDLRVQEIMDKAYENTDLFPGVNVTSKDKDGNALDGNGKVLLYNMKNYFAESGDFVLASDEYKELANGDLMFYGGKRLNFYKTSVGGNIDYSAEFKNLYVVEDNGVFYSISGGVWNIASEYKNRDDDGNLILSAKFLEDKPEAFTKNEDGTLTLSKNYFTLRQKVRQPQSAMVVMDYKTGGILGMIGGRNIDGKLLYNRATSTRQPGSSIKPLAVYSLALQLGANGRAGFTAAMPIDDAPILYAGQLWPKNWYAGYTGITNLRHAVEQSINACAVNLFLKIGDPELSIIQLQKMGITSLVTEGEPNDLNSSALALGGMTKGISPLEMTAAYGTFGNYGVYTEPISYTTVTTKSGDVILSNKPVQVEVLDESVASLMTDILRTVVTNGLGSSARLKSQPSAGKTGTTTDRYDIWFCGLTPQYSAATWIGSDVNIPVNSDSSKAAKLWATVMDQVGALVPREEFVMKGDFVTATVDKYSGTTSPFMDSTSALTEIFIAGTEPGAMEPDEIIGHASAMVCAESGYLATPGCPAVSRVGIIRPSGFSWEKQLVQYTNGGTKELKYGLDALPDAIYDLPDYYCPYHNPDPSAYPVSPLAALHTGTDVYDPEMGEGYIDEEGEYIPTIEELEEMQD
ncbi:MAG: transglycosylase domain-containing protein [Bacillota bacterium]|nr:transglycosylase domain-containing protein [Bacillota bacterium]